MFGYRFGPLGLATTRALPELGAAGRVRRDAWRCEVTTSASAGRVEWLHTWTFPDGRRWARIGRAGSDWVVRFERTAWFRIDVSARRIVAGRYRGVPMATLRHLLLDQVLPLVIAEGPHLALHASAVAIDGGAVAFVGASGSGKSTVAAACARDGHRLVSDDCFVVDVDSRPVRAIPACSGLRLWPDALTTLFGGREAGARVAHYTRKRRLGGSSIAAGAHARPLPVCAVCVLERGRARTLPVVTRLRGREAFASLLPFTFQLDTGGTAAARALDRIAALLRETPAYRLTVPHGLAHLKQVAEAIAAAAGS